MTAGQTIAVLFWLGAVVLFAVAAFWTPEKPHLSRLGAACAVAGFLVEQIVG